MSGKTTFPDDIGEQAMKTFQNYDFDQSGFIEANELKVLMTDVAREINIPDPTDEDIDQVLTESDTNKDKKISKEEFLGLFKIIYNLKTMK